MFSRLLDAKGLVDSASFNEAMKVFPFSKASATQSSLYLDFESKARACFRTVTVPSPDGVQSSSRISWDKVREFVKTPTWPSWLAELTTSGQALVARLNGGVAIRLAQRRSGNLWDVLKRASQRLKDQDRQALASLNEAWASRLGQYTTEQEADDLAAEWLGDAGIDPEHMVLAMKRLGDGLPTSLGGFALGMETCEELFTNDWFRDGQYFFVPIGNYAEVHHSQCYRMFNLSREISAHGLTATGTAPRVPSHSWADLQRSAAAIGTRLVPKNPDDVFSWHPQVAEHVLRDCAYSP
jgi:hypothetical protein